MNFQKIEGLRKGSVNYVYEGYLFIKNKADKETTYLRCYQNKRFIKTNKKVNSIHMDFLKAKISMWGICDVCTLALTVAKTSSHYDRFAISVPARSLLLFDLA